MQFVVLPWDKGPGWAVFTKASYIREFKKVMTTPPACEVDSATALRWASVDCLASLREIKAKLRLGNSMGRRLARMSSYASTVRGLPEIHKLASVVSSSPKNVTWRPITNGSTSPLSRLAMFIQPLLRACVSAMASHPVCITIRGSVHFLYLGCRVVMEY